MATTSKIFNWLIDNTNTAQITHPNDSSTESYYSQIENGDGYFGRSDGIHTVQFNLINFTGIIAVQATLATSPIESDWFTVSQSIHDTTSNSNLKDGSFIYNFTGNFIHLRIKISEYTSGSITSVFLNH